MLCQNENDVNLCKNCVTLLKSGRLTFEINLYSAIMLLLNILIVLIVARGSSMACHIVTFL